MALPLKKALNSVALHNHFSTLKRLTVHEKGILKRSTLLFLTSERKQNHRGFKIVRVVEKIYMRLFYTGYIERLSNLTQSFAHAIFKKRGRDRLFIMAKALDIATDGALKSQIMYKANLSFNQLHDYLSLLLDLGLLKVVRKNGRETYQTTSKGFIYLKSFQEIRGLLSKEAHTKEIDEHIEEQRRQETKDDWDYCPKIEELESGMRILMARVRKLESKIVRKDMCPSCGRGIQPDYRFCPYCGKTLSTSKEKS